MLLWDAVMLPNMGFRNIEKLKAIQCDGAESVKHLQMPKERVIATVKDNLGPFMIYWDTSNLNNDIDDPSEFEDAEENWYTHLLMIKMIAKKQIMIMIMMVKMPKYLI